MARETAKLNVKAAALAVALVWGLLGMLPTGLASLNSTYGDDFLRVMASLYPYYTAEPTLAQVFVGTLWGVIDGLIVGGVFAWLYNRLS